MRTLEEDLLKMDSLHGDELDAHLYEKLTKKQWETIRNFANNWSKECDKYVEETGELEKEFKDKLLANYQIGIFTPIRKKI